MSTDSPALHRLCTATPDEFARDVWARRAWLSRAADLPGTEIFSRDAADELLSRRGLRTPFLRMAKDGKVIPTNRFTGSGGAGAMIADQVRDEAVLGLFADGATVVLQGLHRTWPPISEFTRDLAGELGHPVQVNSYITPPQSQGFAPHYDTHDVFVLQIEGRKQWRVHEPVRREPMPHEPWEQIADAVAERAGQPPTLDVILEPGDCLYLPRGFIHSATALGETSIHLTFGIHATTQQDVLRAILDDVLAGEWRSTMPMGWSGLDGLEDVRARAVTALAGTDLESVSHMLQDDQARKTRPEPLSPLSQARHAASVEPSSSVRMRGGLAPRLDGSRLVTSTGAIDISEDERDAIAMLMKGQEIQVGDLPLAPDRALALCGLLLRKGVLVPGASA